MGGRVRVFGVVAGAFGVSVALGFSPVRAEEVAPAKERPVSAACPRTDAENLDTLSRLGGLSAEFQCLIAASEFRAALAPLEVACSIANDASCSFNRAYIHHALLGVSGESHEENCRLSSDAYAEYLLLEPYDDYREGAIEALAELGQRCGSRAEVPVPELPSHDAAARRGVTIIPALVGDAPPERGADRARGAPRAARAVLAGREGFEPLRTAAWITFAAASASAVAGLVYWKRLSDADSALKRRVAWIDDSRNDPRNRALDRERHGEQRRAWAFGIGAAALAGAGVTLLWLDADFAGAQLSLALDGDGSGLRVSGNF